MTAKAICEQEQTDIQVMSSGAKLKLARTSFESAPAWCAHARTTTPAARAKQILQLKGFVGGVPLNTETAAVNPRAGIQ
jgi:hypothetical protein